MGFELPNVVSSDEEEYQEETGGPMVCAMGDEGDWSEKQAWVFCDECNSKWHLRCLGLSKLTGVDDEFVCSLCRNKEEYTRFSSKNGVFQHHPFGHPSLHAGEPQDSKSKTQKRFQLI